MGVILDIFQNIHILIYKCVKDLEKIHELLIKIFDKTQSIL